MVAARRRMLNSDSNWKLISQTLERASGSGTFAPIFSTLWAIINVKTVNLLFARIHKLIESKVESAQAAKTEKITGWADRHWIDVEKWRMTNFSRRRTRGGTSAP